MLHVNTNGTQVLNGTQSETCTYTQRQVGVAPFFLLFTPQVY
jgi:hypothetical protein